MYWNTLCTDVSLSVAHVLVHCSFRYGDDNDVKEMVAVIRKMQAAGFDLQASHQLCLSAAAGCTQGIKVSNISVFQTLTGGTSTSTGHASSH